MLCEALSMWFWNVVLPALVGCLACVVGFWRGQVVAFRHVEGFLINEATTMRTRGGPEAIVELPGVQAIVRRYHLRYGGK